MRFLTRSDDALRAGVSIRAAPPGMWESYAVACALSDAGSERIREDPDRFRGA